MRYMILGLNVVGLALACISLIGRMLVPTSIDATLVGTLLYFLPFVLALFAYRKDQRMALRRVAIAANILGVLFFSAGIFVVLRSGIETAGRIVVLLALVGLVPCLANVVYFSGTRSAQGSAANTSLDA